MAKYGLDLSKHQGSLNFKAIAKENSFVILRIGFGVSYLPDKQKDAKFEDYYKKAKENGLLIGGYYYSYAKSVDDAKKEAQNCLKYLGDKHLDYPIYYDCEDPGTVGKKSKSTIAKMCDAFCEVIEKAGYTAGVYASTNWFKNKGVKNANKKWVRWEANYGKNDGKTISKNLYNKNVPMHQYTSKFSGKYRPDGKAIHVDRNIDYSTPVTPEKPQPKPDPKPEPVPPKPKPEPKVQKAIYPMKNGRFSAIYNHSAPHIACSTGKPKDFPTDIVGKDQGRDWAYAPCDMIVLRKYKKASHAIWLRSKDKVMIPCCDEPVYLYMMSEHQDNAEMDALKGTIKQKEKLFREGKNGRATGYHLHVSFAYSEKAVDLGTGWRCNNKKAWVLFIPGAKNIKINEALFLDKDFTKVIDFKGTKFKEV